MEDAIKLVMRNLPESKNINKSNATTVIESLVRKDILKGKDRQYIIDKMVNDGYKLGHTWSEGTAKCIVHNVNSRLKQSVKELQEEALDRITSQFADLYEKNYDKEQYSECKDILKELAKMLGINSGNKVSITKDELKIEFA